MTGSAPIGAVALCYPADAPVPEESLEFASAVAAQCAQALERAQLFEAQREVVGILQRSLLPARMPKVHGAEFAVRYLPAAGLEAGGDFYEAIRLRDGAIGLAVGDVVGRGAKAAAVMGQLRSALRAFALDGAGPGEVLGRLSRFADTVDDALAATAAYAVVEASGELRYSCAGHPHPVLAHADGRVEFLGEARGLPLGVRDVGAYPEAVARLEADSTLLLYTDGLVERRGEDTDAALDVLRNTLRELAAAPLPIVLDEVVRRQAGEAPADDIALIAVRVACSQPALRIETPAIPDAVGEIRHALRDWLQGQDIPRASSTDVLLAAGEAVSNAVEHGYAGKAPGPVRVDVRRSEDLLEITVADEGAWREEASDPDRGRGFTLMHAVMDEVDVTRGAAGTAVHLRLAVPVVAGAPPRATPSAPAPAPAPPAGPAHLELAAGTVPHARITGDLDLVTAPGLAEQLRSLAPGGPLVIDLTDATFVDSSGVRVLLTAARMRTRARGGRLTVIAPPGSPARRALELASVGELLSLRDA